MGTSWVLGKGLVGATQKTHATALWMTFVGAPLAPFGPVFATQGPWAPGPSLAPPWALSGPTLGPLPLLIMGPLPTGPPLERLISCRGSLT